MHCEAAKIHSHVFVSCVKQDKSSLNLSLPLHLHNFSLRYNSKTLSADNPFTRQVFCIWKFLKNNCSPMNPIILCVFSCLFMITTFSLEAQPPKTNAQITVMGFVYCDTCHNNTFSSHSYFMSDAQVKLDCDFKAFYPKTSEQIQFSVNRSTDKHGLYRLQIPSVDEISCAEANIASFCQATLVGTSSKTCNVPGYRMTADSITIKARQPNICFYSLTALNFRPLKRDVRLCGKRTRFL